MYTYKYEKISQTPQWRQHQQNKEQHMSPPFSHSIQFMAFDWADEKGRKEYHILKIYKARAVLVQNIQLLMLTLTDIIDKYLCT